MDINKFNQYKDFKSKDLKKKATVALKSFIDSIKSEEELESWTISYLNSIPKGSHEILRHELFEQVIFPVLLKGYNNKDLWSHLVLARFIQNLYQSKSMHQKIDNKSDHEILKECLKIDPTHIESRERLLNVQIRWFEYCEHEWPSGILYGTNGATKQQVEEILLELDQARSLDEDKKHKQFFDSFEKKIKIYIKRISNR